MSTDKHKPTIDEMEDSINAGGDVPFEILPSGEIVTKELKNVQPVMGGKFSDNPDPPCVHCGEDAIELEHLRTRVAQMELDNFELRVRADKLKGWVDDLQAGCYINCVYCGHRYGPDDEVPASMADVLKEHIEHCPEHPMSKLKVELAKCHHA